MAGYSDRTLKDKLGIKPDIKICLLNIPNNYLELTGSLKNDVDLELKGKYDFIHFFTKDQMSLVRNVGLLKSSLNDYGMIWISWPKTSSKMQTNISEQVIRDICLLEGLVDIKVCAIDNIWLGLKFVVRIR